jgi:hypothetical protein
MSSFDEKNYTKAIHEFSLSLLYENKNDTEVLKKRSFCYSYLELRFEYIFDLKTCLQIDLNDLEVYIWIAKAQQKIEQFNYAKQTIRNCSERCRADDFEMKLKCDDNEKLSNRLNSAYTSMRFCFYNFFFFKCLNKFFNAKYYYLYYVHYVCISSFFF